MTSFDEVIDRRGSGCEKWDSQKEVFGAENLLPLWVADTEFPAPDSVLEALRKRVSHPVFGYTRCEESVPAAFQGWMRRRHGFDVPEGAVCVCTSLMSGTSIAINALTQPGEPIVTLTPVYNPFYDVIVNNGRTLETSPLRFADGSWEIDLDELEGHFQRGCRFMLFCNPHNPTGRVWTRAELQQLAQLILHYRVTVVSDDIHSDIVYPGHVYTPLVSVDERLRRQVITSYSTSKTFNIAGIKGAYCLIDDEEKRRAFQAFQKRIYTHELSLFCYLTMEAAYTGGDGYCDALCAYLKENIRLACSYAREHLPSLRVYEPQGTYLMLFDCSALGLTGNALTKWFASKAGVALSTGANYGRALESFERVNIACPRTMLLEALEKIRAALDASRAG